MDWFDRKIVEYVRVESPCCVSSGVPLFPRSRRFPLPRLTATSTTTAIRSAGSGPSGSQTRRLHAGTASPADGRTMGLRARSGSPSGCQCGHARLHVGGRSGPPHELRTSAYRACHQTRPAQRDFLQREASRWDDRSLPQRPVLRRAALGARAQVSRCP
jgi:hypothetical protein